MNKTLVKEVPFGKAIARITVTMFTEIGAFLNENVISTSAVEIIANGKVVESGYFANVLEFNDNTETYFYKNNLDVASKYTRVGDRAITLGAETGNLINTVIDEMKATLSTEFNIETEEEKQRKETLAEAQAIVAQAEKEGIDKLLSDAQVKAWRKRYNDIYNEGGEGYIPNKISKEAYQKAINILNEYGGK